MQTRTKRSASKSTAKSKSTSNYAETPPEAAKKAKEDAIGWVTHTDMRSDDPNATQNWARRVFGWHFSEPMKSPEGDYLMFQYSMLGGGGIQKTMPGEKPSTTPFVNVKDCQAAYDKAIGAGAEPGSEPKDMGAFTIATVRAPGGVLIGLASASK